MVDYTDRSILGNVILRVEARVVDDRFYNALRRMVRVLDDPKSSVYLLLLGGLRPLSRKELLKLTRYDEATLDRALRFLFRNKLLDKRELARREVLYYATIP